MATTDTPAGGAKPKAGTSKANVPRKVRFLAFGLGLLVWGLSSRYLPVLNRLELILSDFRFSSRVSPPPSDKVALVMIDEAALHELGRWPWPRSVFAELVKALDEAGAKVVAFEMAFIEPDTRCSGDMMESLRRALDAHGVAAPGVKEEISRLEAAADTDAALARAIQESKSSVILSYLFHERADDLAVDLSAEERAAQSARIEASRFQITHLPAGKLRPPVPTCYLPQPAVPVLSQATPWAGFLQIWADADGGVRRATLALEHEGAYYPSLAVQAAWQYFGRPFSLGIYGGANEVEQIEIGKGRSVYTSERGEILINYLGGPGTFPRLSVADVIARRIPKGALEGKIVLVGSAAKGLTRDLKTPMSSFHPGVEIQATIIDNLVEGRVLERPSWFDLVDLLILVAMAAAGSLFLGRLGVVAELLLTVVAGAGYVGVNFWAFQQLGLPLTTLYPVLALVLAYLTLTLSRYLQERDQRQQIEGAFGRYVAPRVIEQMMSNPDQLKLGGEERLITVLFSDLSGFTAVSEKLTPSQMVELMCEYFEEMTARIYEQDGLLKEYVGDEIMAMFGAPLVQPDHAARACKAALAMHARLEQLADHWVSLGRPRLGARWGVNSGVVLVGNLGSSYRYSYGALGDNVNLGSRLEGLNGQYGTRILIGENTRELVGNDFLVREVDTVAVKGKAKGIRVFELLGTVDRELLPERIEANGLYAEGLAAYRAGDFTKALERFDRVLALSPADGPAKVMKSRAEGYLEAPPGDDWNGVFVATKK